MSALDELKKSPKKTPIEWAILIVSDGMAPGTTEVELASKAAAEYAALLARVERLEEHTRKLISLALSFKEDDTWIFERYSGEEIVSSAAAALEEARKP